MSVAFVLSPAEDLHQRLLAAHASYRRSERDLAVLLAEMADRRLYVEFGDASVLAYAERVLDLPRRQAADLVRIGQKLAELPEVDAAFSAGAFGWTKAREIVRVASAGNEAAWVERARTLSSRDLERHVASARDGEPPDPDEVEKGPARVRMVFEVDAVDAEVIRDALRLLRAQTGPGVEEVDDGTLLAEIARRTIHDAEPAEAPTGERYVTVLEHCPTCRHTAGVDAEVTDTHVGLADCDGEQVELREGPDRGSMAKAIPPKVRRAVLFRDRQRCAVMGCRNKLWVNLHHVLERHRGGQHTEDNLVTLCTIHHRVVHDGRMAVRAVDGGFEFEFANGTVVRSTPWSRRPRSS